MECLRKKQFFVTFRVGLYEKQLGLLREGKGGDIPLTDMLLICQISFIFILRLYDLGG